MSEEKSKIDPEPQFRAALIHAFHLLETRDRYVAEVRSHLARKGCAELVVEEVVSFLLERRLINENTTTQNLIETRSGKRSVGIEKLRVELERLGAPEEILERNLAELAATEPQRALDALRAKYKRGAHRGKAGRFLYSRGFTEDVIESALDDFCGSEAFPE